MSIDRIRAFVARLKPALVCDACIADRLGIAGADVNTTIHELSGHAEFERLVGQCTLCQNSRQATRAR